jgi:single-strand DNA-binding protein
MRSVNKVTLVGNVGSKVETKYISATEKICNFSLATNEEWTDRNGERKSRTEWHNIAAFGPLAGICERFLTTGKQIYVEGKIRTDSWEDAEGNKKQSKKIVISEMLMLGTKGNTSDS